MASAYTLSVVVIKFPQSIDISLRCGDVMSNGYLDGKCGYRDGLSSVGKE